MSNQSKEKAEPNLGPEQRPSPKSRLLEQPAEIIDRRQSFAFDFEGKRYAAYGGDTIASALAAAGVKVFSRSFKYHRPRGLMCCAGQCPNCLVQVGEEMNVRACITPVMPGMNVKAQNAWPSLDRDVMALTKLGDRFLPVGFYYKAFIRPKSLWPAYENIIRRAAGLGKVDPDSMPGDYDKQYLHADVAVVGGGPAGLSAALAAAEQGARVLLFDENPGLGGHQRFAGSRKDSSLPELLEAVKHQSNLNCYTDTTVLGWFEQNWLSAVQGNRLYKIRVGRLVVTTGAYEQPLLFDNNDLPGVMLGSGVQRLLHLYGVAPGQRALVVTANDDGWAVAADLQSAGVEVAVLVDERLNSSVSELTRPLAEQVEEAGTHVFRGYTILQADGPGKVSKAIIAPVDEHGQISTGAKKMVHCDLIVVSVGWTPANGLLHLANGKVAYDDERAEFLPQSLPDGIYAAGRVTGTHDVENQLAEGRLAGLQAAASLGLGDGSDGDHPLVEEQENLEKRKADELRRHGARTSTLVSVPGGKKQFLCFCEDVTKKDLETAVAEGYNSIELLKRYSTISMGPCQGRMCSSNTIHLCARANNWTVEQTGTTRARPPMTPVKLGVLAGQHMEPVQLSPVHDWHLARGAKMMVAGLWLRPEHYGDSTAEVRAVRERVGLIDVSTLGKLRLTGPGVPDLLDRLYVNKWQKLPVGRVRYGLMCNDEGIVLDDGVTAHVADLEWYTTTTSSGASAIYEWMQWWAQSGWGDGVHITNVTELNAAFNLAGPQSRAVLQKLTEADLSSEALPYMGFQDVNLAGVPCRLLRIGFTGELSYEIHCPAGYGLYVWNSLMQAGEEFDIQPFGVEAQRVLRLEKAHIIIGQDTDALSDPIAADMAWLVKLDKADFLGQRPLIRIESEGPSQRLVGFEMADSSIVPDEGLQIIEPGADGNLNIVGWVTSSRYSPTLNASIGLCWLPAAVAEKDGATFTIRMNGQLAEARVHHGPFYDSEGKRLRT